VQGTVAVTTVAALGDLIRFAHPRQLMGYLGLTPSAASSGERRRQGASTKAGHPQARRALGEGAWASRSPAQVRWPLQWRLENPPTALQAISWQAQGRLCTRSRRLLARGTHAHQVVVALAHEGVGFLWAIAPQVPRTAYLCKIEPDCTPNIESGQRALEEAQPRWGGTLDSVTRPSREARPASEAGPRRTQGRWEPTHGEQQDPPSSFLAPALPMRKGTKIL
jgi:hypothetical protein